jgi:hypothetical protein
MTLINY